MRSIIRRATSFSADQSIRRLLFSRRDFSEVDRCFGVTRTDIETSPVALHSRARAAPAKSSRPTIEAAADQTERTLRHIAIVRVTHWIMAASVFGLLVTGGGILISHPRLIIIGRFTVIFSAIISAYS
jgi:hypothetical protein